MSNQSPRALSSDHRSAGRSVDPSPIAASPARKPISFQNLPLPLSLTLALAPKIDNLKMQDGNQTSEHRFRCDARLTRQLCDAKHQSASDLSVAGVGRSAGRER